MVKYGRFWSQAVQKMAPAVAQAVKSYRKYNRATKRLRSGKKKARSVATQTQTRKRRSGGPAFFTVGYGPRKFKSYKRRVHPVSKCRKYGSDVVFERRGVITDAERVDIGHAEIAPVETFRSVVRGLYRSVYERSGNYITNWLGTPACREAAGVVQTQYISYIIRYKNTETGTILTSTTAVSGTDKSHFDIAEEITGVLVDLITDTDYCLILEAIVIYNEDTNASAIKWSGECNFLSSKVMLNVTSCLVVQNRTKGAAATDDQADDVTNNPVYGRQWVVRGNGMSARVSNNNFATVMAGVVSDNYGLITGGSGQQGTLKKIASPSMWQYTMSSGAARIQPGQVKKSVLNFSRTMSLKTFFEAYRTWIKRATSVNLANDIPTRIGMGKSRYFQFEKLCDTGSGTESIALGYELNQTISSMVMYDNHQGTSRITRSS